MKIYRAVAIGKLPRSWKEIRTDIDGYIAATHVKTLDSNRQASYLELRIETGRTHQIRRQLADKRHPVMGDKRYAGTGNEWSLAQPRQMLHAYRLVFTHPANGRSIRATAPLPGDFKRCLSQLKLR
jgi:23S rRNA pseudouridine1911/1915/1917 synthase